MTNLRERFFAKVFFLTIEIHFSCVSSSYWLNHFYLKFLITKLHYMCEILFWGTRPMRMLLRRKHDDFIMFYNGKQFGQRGRKRSKFVYSLIINTLNLSVHCFHANKSLLMKLAVIFLFFWLKAYFFIFL